MLGRRTMGASWTIRSAGLVAWLPVQRRLAVAAGRWGLGWSHTCPGCVLAHVAVLVGPDRLGAAPLTPRIVGRLWRRNRPNGAAWRRAERGALDLK